MPNDNEYVECTCGNGCEKLKRCEQCFQFKCECSCLDEEATENFIKKYKLDSEFWKHKLLCVPFKKDEEFVLNLEFIGDDHYISGMHKKDMIKWLKLTEKLMR